MLFKGLSKIGRVIAFSAAKFVRFTVGGKKNRALTLKLYYLVNARFFLPPTVNFVIKLKDILDNDIGILDGGLHFT